MAKDKYNVKDPRYFNAKHLVKWLKKNFKEKGFEFKLTKEGKEVSLDENEKDDNVKLDKYAIKIKGNPYKLKDHLPEDWVFNGKQIVNKNKNEPDYFGVVAESGLDPLKYIEDPLDLTWAIQSLNPDIRILRRDGATNFEIDGKAPEDLNLPQGFLFDKEQGTITNNGNVAEATQRPLALSVAKSKGDVNFNRSEVGEAVGDGLDKFKNAGNTPGKDLSSATPQGEQADTWSKIIFSTSPELIAGSIDNMNFHEAFALYEKYSLTLDGFNRPAVQFSGSGAESGQLIYDERIIQCIALMDSLINTYFNNGDMMQNRLTVSKKDLTAEEVQKLKDLYEQFATKDGVKEEENEQGQTELLEEIVEDNMHDKANKRPEETTEDEISKAEAAGVDVVDGSQQDTKYLLIVEQAQVVKPIITKDGPNLLYRTQDEFYAGTFKDEILLFYAVMHDMEERGIEIHSGNINTTLKAEYLDILNNHPEWHDVLIEKLGQKMLQDERDKEANDLEPVKEMVRNIYNGNNDNN